MGYMFSTCSIHSLVEITSRKVIKPSTPTPHHHRILNLSLLDQFLPPTLYPTLVFFYGGQYLGNDPNVSKNTCRLLQESLSKTLVHYYPLAGRLKGHASVDCNDEGAHFIEARVNCKLSDFLKQPDPKLLKQFLPETDTETAQVALGSVLLLVQISIFNCGGIAVAMSPSHKIADATSLYTFAQTWAAINRDCEKYEVDPALGVQLVLPEFIGGSLLPSRELSLPAITMEIPSQNLTTKRFVFYISNMASLKEKIGGLVHNFMPTNVQLVLAIILRCGIAASHRSNPEISIRPTVLTQMVNLRRRMVPEIPQNAMGNWFWSLAILFKEKETELHELVSNMRKGLVDFCNDKANRFKGEEGFLVVSECIRERGDLFQSSNNGVNLYMNTSLCKFRTYDLDFGWGKPTWVTSQGNHMKNLIVLLDTKWGDGIEAWVTLDEQEMAIFESDEELLAFASVNPTPLLNPMILPKCSL